MTGVPARAALLVSGSQLDIWRTDSCEPEPSCVGARADVSGGSPLLQPPGPTKPAKSCVRRELDELLVRLAVPPSCDSEGVCSVDFFENGNGWVGVAEVLRERCPPRRLRAYVEGAGSRQEAERGVLAFLQVAVGELCVEARQAQLLESECLAGDRLEAL